LGDIMDFMEIVLVSLMAIILILTFSFLINKAVQLFDNPGED